MPISLADIIARDRKRLRAGHLDRFVGGPQSHMRTFLGMQSTSIVRLFDDFHYYTDAEEWTKAVDTSATVAVLAGAGGRLRLRTANAQDNDAAAFYATNATWYGDNCCAMEVRFQANVAGASQIEIGFADPLTDYTLPACDNVDTPSTGNGATDVAVFHIDSDATLKTPQFVTDGGSGGYNTTKTELSATEGLTANNWYRVVVGLAGDASFCFFYDDETRPGGALLGSAVHGATAASSIEGGTALAPYVFFRTRAAADVALLVDYIDVWQDRYTRTA